MATMEDIIRDLQSEKATRTIKNVPIVLPDTSPIRKPTGPTIAVVAARVLPPFVALRDKFGYIHDSSSIAIKCRHGHIHKYPIDNIANFGIKQCTTCDAGTKFDNFARKLIESVLGEPFILIAAHTYQCPTLGITIACCKPPKKSADLVIVLYETKSEKKILEIIREKLINFPGLTSDQKTRLGIRDGIRPVHTNTRLPYSSALAELSGVKDHVLVDDDELLYFEGCHTSVPSI